MLAALAAALPAMEGGALLRLRECLAQGAPLNHVRAGVYAAGVRASATRVPGVKEHCLFLKELADAQALRRAVASALERASEKT